MIHRRTSALFLRWTLAVMALGLVFGVGVIVWFFGRMSGLGDRGVEESTRQGQEVAAAIERELEALPHSEPVTNEVVRAIAERHATEIRSARAAPSQQTIVLLVHGVSLELCFEFVVRDAGTTREVSHHDLPSCYDR